MPLPSIQSSQFAADPLRLAPHQQPPVHISAEMDERTTPNLHHWQSAPVMLLSIGSDYLSQGMHEEALNAFDAAFQSLSSPSIGPAYSSFASVNTTSALGAVIADTAAFAQLKWKEEQHKHKQTQLRHPLPRHQHTDVNIVTDDDVEVGANGAVAFIPTPATSTTPSPVDTYLEDECDVGPRPFHTAIVPTQDEMMMMNIDVLQLIICYNQALVRHAKSEYSLALQLYNYVTGTVRIAFAAASHSLHPNPALSTMALLAMRSHNNLGQIEYAERSEEIALWQFETALSYARQVQQDSNMVSASSHQLEIATILSNWCRGQWMLGRADDTVYQTLEEVLRIRFSFLGWDHVDVASSHFNLGMAEYSRQANEKALAHLMQYLQVSSHRLKSNKTLELDPIPGLIFVLLIKNAKKEDKMSQDLVWGLRTLQDKRQDLGPKNAEVASVLNFIGTLLFHQRELDHALLFFQEELRLEERLVGSDEDVSVSVTCNNIGRILQELGRYPQAIYYYQRSLRHKYGELFAAKTSCKDSKSCDLSMEDKIVNGNADASDIPPATMNLYSTVWYNLGLIHDKMGAFADAIQAFRMSLKLRRAMLGRDHSDVACLLYNIGVLQMEQQLLNDATLSFREALRIRRVAATGQLNDRHVVKTLQKLASLHKAKGNIQGALEACGEVLRVLKASVDFEWINCCKNMGTTLREIAELHHAEGNLPLALDRAAESFNLLRSSRTSNCGAQDIQDAAETQAIIEQETASLLLIGSLQHEGCHSIEARATFAEAARLIQNAINESSGNSNIAGLLPLFEVSSMLASAHCAPEA
jgi:tetratricopeptide (TPR) repeat protein